LEKQVASVRERFGTIIADIESTWKMSEMAEMNYRFSDTLKGSGIVLPEGNLRVKNNISSYQLAVV
jgi:hypothetical protein